MSKTVSIKTKLKQKRGQGHGRDYKPWIRSDEMPGHESTFRTPIDWKHGRTMQLLSSGEMDLYYILRWRDDVIDIREQFPLLPIESTIEIAKIHGRRHPRDKNGYVVLTSDMLVDYADGHQEVYSVKYSKKDLLDEKNQMKNIWLEKQFWQSQENPPDYRIVFEKELNTVLAQNICRIVYYWQPESVTDKVSLFYFLAAHKKIAIPDFETESLTPYRSKELADQYISDRGLDKKIEQAQEMAKLLKQYQYEMNDNKN